MVAVVGAASWCGGAAVGVATWRGVAAVGTASRRGVAVVGTATWSGVEALARQVGEKGGRWRGELVEWWASLPAGRPAGRSVGQAGEFYHRMGWLRN